MLLAGLALLVVYAAHPDPEGRVERRLGLIRLQRQNILAAQQVPDRSAPRADQAFEELGQALR